jgi:RNA polymerase sigma factor (sigma-70 family)
MKITTQLLKQCSENDRRAQIVLYKICFPSLMNVAMRYMVNKDDAAVMVNEGFLKIVQNLDKYSSKVPFKAWVSRVLINTIIDEFRKNKKYKELHDQKGSTIQLEHSIKQEIEIKDEHKEFTADEIITLIANLPTSSRKIFNLFAIDGYSHKEISDMFDIKEGTSKWHVSSARQELKKLMLEFKENGKRK